jgi:hypothetical protein
VSQAEGDNQFSVKDEKIKDPGLGERLMHTAGNLKPSTIYQFRVCATNKHNGGSLTLGDVITVTTLGKHLKAKSH